MIVMENVVVEYSKFKLQLFLAGQQRNDYRTGWRERSRENDCL